MKKLLLPSLLLLALTSTPCHAGWFSDFISTVTPGGWIEQTWDKVFGNDDSKGISKSSGVSKSSGIDTGTISSVPEINPAIMLMVGAVLLMLRKKYGKK